MFSKSYQITKKCIKQEEANNKGNELTILAKVNTEPRICNR